MPKPSKKKGQKSESSTKEPTVQEPPPVLEEEKDQNVGSSSSKAKRKEKKDKMKQIYEAARQSSSTAKSSSELSQAPEHPPVETPEQLPVQIPEVKPIVEEVATEVVNVTEKMEEVELRSDKKKRPRKKKTPATTDTPAAPATSVITGTPAAQATASAFSSLGSTSTQPSISPAGSCGRGWGRGAGQSAAIGQATPPYALAQPSQYAAPAGVPTAFSPPVLTPTQQSNLPSGSHSMGRGWGRGSGEMPQQPSPQQYQNPQQSYWPQPQAPQQSFWPQSQTPQEAGRQQRPRPPIQQPSGQQGPQPPFQQPGGPQRPQPPSQQPEGQQQKPQMPQQSQISRPSPNPSRENILCRYRIPTKISGNTVRCKRLNILTNYLEMTFQPLQISRYDVSFTPDKPKKMLSKAFKVFKQKHYPKELLAFDQMKNCYSLRPLKNVPSNERFIGVVDVEDSNKKQMKFEVSLKATGVVDLSKIQRYMRERSSSSVHPTEEVQCIDVILRQGTLESYVKAGRQFFLRPMQPIDLGHGYEMWTGLFQSAIFTSKAFINIDVAHKGFPIHQSLIDSLKAFNLKTNASIESQKPRYEGDRYGAEVEQFMRFIKGLKVAALMVGNTPTAGQKREYIINGLVDPPGKQKFLLNQPDGSTRSTTVTEYFAKDKKYTIQYPQLNCVWVGPRDKSVYFPMELLEISYGQPLSRQLNETQIAKMVKEAATPPDRRMQKIQEVISSMNYSRNPDFKSFGLSISENFYEVTSKILDPPLLDVGRESIRPRNGIWQAKSLLKAQPLQSWGFIAVEPRNRGCDFSSTIQMISNTARQMGMQVTDPKMVKFDVEMRSLNNVLLTALDNDIKFMFVVVSSKSKDYYHMVKRLAELEVGMLTQCIKEATVARMNPMTAKNILLKVNSKLMGINQAIGDQTLPKCLRSGGVMIVGADVTHPSPDQSNVPSIAAVTASIDPKCYMYNIELSIQTPKKEMIVDFEEMMIDHLRVFKERNMGRLPIKIFVFRDGVSERQFTQVMNSELTAVHAAYARLAGPGKKPEVLFLLVQKRHHTRFFNKSPNTKYNVEPGTVVDTDIVHASELDFYLVSHQAIKGTARPTRYHAVCNDGHIPDDEVEQLTYYLCHLYSRCMRAVSYPAPTYYAHLACLRARSLTFGDKFDNNDLEKAPRRLHVLDKMLQHSRMFYV